MPELKPRSMRMSDENYTRLQNLSEGRSLDETITFLLSTHDKDEERSGLGNQAVKLDELDEFLNAIRSQFAALLYSCQNAKEIVRTEYRKELEEKNTAIDRMKDDILKLQKEIMRKDASAQETIEQLRSQLDDAKKEIATWTEKAASSESNATQKQKVIDSLSAALSSTEKKANRLEETEKLLVNTETMLKELRIQYADLKKSQNLLQKKAEESASAYQQQKEENTKMLKQCQTDKEEQLAKCRLDCEEKIQQLKVQQEQAMKALRMETELSIKEAQLHAQSSINEMKEEYQNKLFELILSKDT